MISAAVSTATYPAALRWYTQTAFSMIITDYIGEEYTPNFYNLIKDDEFLKKAVTDDEGRTSVWALRSAEAKKQT